MTDYLDEHYEKCDALLARIDALFPAQDGGYGDDMRRMMRLASFHAGGIGHDYARSILSIVAELVCRMEIDQREAEAEDAYWSAVHDATVGA